MAEAQTKGREKSPEIGQGLTTEDYVGRAKNVASSWGRVGGQQKHDSQLVLGVGSDSRGEKAVGGAVKIGGGARG